MKNKEFVRCTTCGKDMEKGNIRKKPYCEKCISKMDIIRKKVLGLLPDEEYKANDNDELSKRILGLLPLEEYQETMDDKINSLEGSIERVLDKLDNSKLDEKTKIKFLKNCITKFVKKI